MWNKVTQPGWTENQNVMKWNLQPLYQRQWGRQEGKPRPSICEGKLREVTRVHSIPLTLPNRQPLQRSSSQSQARVLPLATAQALPMIHFHFLRKPKATRAKRAERTGALWTRHEPPETTPLVSKWKRIPRTWSQSLQIPQLAQALYLIKSVCVSVCKCSVEWGVTKETRRGGRGWILRKNRSSKKSD